MNSIDDMENEKYFYDYYDEIEYNTNIMIIKQNISVFIYIVITIFIVYFFIYYKIWNNKISQ